MEVKADFPPKLECLFTPSRYKVLHGGRGGAKSWGVARALIIQCIQRPIRILCCREFQSSIRDSVHKLLTDQIYALGLDSLFLIEQASIKSSNGSEFFFEGLRHNVAKIKSFEGVDIAWVEEAQTVSKTSWEVLIPTVRKDNSEIWLTFNPELETDETYQRFVINPPDNALVQKVNWTDNPWFPEVLRIEKDQLKDRDPDAYLNVWEGNCRQALDGAIYADELRDAQATGRITRVPYDNTKPVHTSWDLGWSDNTSIWFGQIVGFEYRLIDFYQNSQKTINHYLEILQGKHYIYGTDYLPHDARAKQLGTGRSIEELMRAAGRNVRVVPQLSVSDGINAARTMFSNCWFDQEKCADGLQCLRHYRYESDPDTGTLARKPLHDWASHGADSFRYMALSLKEGTKKTLDLSSPPRTVYTPVEGTSWMA